MSSPWTRNETPMGDNNRIMAGEHPPRGFVGDSGFPFQLLGRYAGASRGHKEHGVEPNLERRRGLVEDRVCGGRDMRATELARVDLAAPYPVVVRDLIALDAMHAVRPSGILHELQSGIFVGELLLKVLYRVLFHAIIALGKVRVVNG